jgi:alkanesulfonate monooxygenase SsuD/methylene tetrahydromethanopterin reductase-like flavin-dependent oxidoreductase (luciferase family)
VSARAPLPGTDRPVQLGFGLISCQRYPGDRRSDADRYREALELAEEAERLGFDSVWTSEHHFVDDAYMPSVLPVCAAIAARTTRVAVGTALVLAPFYDPLRLAEDAATVDLIAGGRFVLGLGLGWRAEEFEALGVRLSERARRLEDAVAVLRQAWSGGLVTGTPSRPYGGVAVTPAPAASSGPPIWIGAFVERAVRRAGRISDGFMATEVTPSSFAEQVRWAREELERAGRDPAEFTWSMHLPTFAWPDGEEGWRLVLPHHHYVWWKYEDMEDARGRTGPPPPAPPITAEREAELRDMIVCGTPAEVAEQIGALRDAAGGRLHYIARLYWPGMEAGVQRAAMRVFAEEVAPALR